MLDTLHFQDALFVNVTPHVVLAHSAERLLQMWTEIVTMYRNAVAQAKDAAAHNDNVHSFFDFCAGRLDLLYLHMAMLLEPKLYELVMSDKIPGSDPFSRAKASPLPAAGSDAVKAATQSTNETKPKASTKAATAKTTAVKDTKPAPSKTSAHVDARPAPAQALTPSDTKLAPVKASALTDTKLAPTKASTDSKPAPSKAASSTDTKPSPEMAKAAIPIASVAAVVAAPATHVKLSKIPTQNPEMEEPPAPAVTKSAAVVVPPKPTAAKANKTVMKGKQSKPAATPPKPTAQKKPQKAAGKAKAASASLAKETKQTASPAKKKSAASPSKPKAPSKSTHGKASGGDKPVKPQKTSNGKRRREEDDSTAIIEVPSVSDIVPRSDKRVHTTTTISTALATRSTDMMLPPDEWDILENRLRKVNENIDRCHRGLAGLEVNVSDSYKQSLEADLRFYSAIKQRLQEQLLVVMQSGY
ncbi:unnamed protein product [Phytophthora lilii]|uniref:Unnamed protein product n=1 Tax=Phytophthora lilii TaxID=2077276 RepID=A0A9W6YHU4_9STRA|nr:unnamed protein product [Phytophthora lilii]